MTFDEWWYDYRIKNGMLTTYKAKEKIARAAWEAAMPQPAALSPNLTPQAVADSATTDPTSAPQADPVIGIASCEKPADSPADAGADLMAQELDSIADEELDDSPGSARIVRNAAKMLRRQAEELAEAARLIDTIDRTGLLFKHHIALDAEVAGFLHRRETRREP